MILTRLAYYALGAIHQLPLPLTYDARIPFYQRPNIMRSPVKKAEKEGKQAKKREEADTTSSKEVPPLKKCMRGLIPT